MLLLDRPLVFFDLEATGISPENDRIVDVALVKRSPDGSDMAFASLINPGMPIPREAVAVHHITDEMVAQSPRFSEIAARVLEFIGDADLGGFNIMRFDIPLLQAELGRAGYSLKLDDRRFVDSQVIFHRMERRTLSAAYQLYCGKPLPDAHRAEPDARASLEVFFKQLERYPQLATTMGEISAFCLARDPGKVDAEGKLVWRNGEAAFNFGKHRTLTLREVVIKERGYVEWLKRAERTTPELAKICEEALAGRFPTPKTAA